jgi:hypothetical protein
MADEQAQYRVCTWLGKAYDRFKNMSDAGKDLNGLPAITKARDSLNDNKYITVGHVDYLFHRTHAQGKYANYNTKWGYNKRYGDMAPCNLNDIIDSELVNWDTGTPSTELRTAIAADTDWTWQQGTLKRKPAKIADVFES